VTPGEFKPSDSEQVKRAAAVGHHFEVALAKLLGTGTCIVHDMDVFSDPRNFPAQRGSMLVTIMVEASLRNAGTAAISVDFDAAEGPYVENIFHITTAAVLIEPGSDFDAAAERVMRWECAIGARLSHPSDPAASKECWESPSPRRPAPVK